MAGEKELSYLFQPSADTSVSSVGSLMAPNASSGGAMGLFSSLAPVIGPMAAIASLASMFMGGAANSQAKMVQERDAALAQQQAGFRAQDEMTRNGWQQQAAVDFENLIKSDPQIANSLDQIVSNEETKNMLQSLYNSIEQRTKAQWQWDRASKYGQRPDWETAPGSRGYMDSPNYAASTESINNTLNNLKTKVAPSSQGLSGMSQQQIQSIAQPSTPNASSPTLYGANPPAGAVAGANTSVQPSGTQNNLQQSFQQQNPQQNFLQQLLAAFQGPGNNNMLAQAGQGAGIGAGNSMGLSPLLGATVGAGLGQFGSAVGNLAGPALGFGGSQQSGNQFGQQPGNPGQPPLQPGGFSNQNFFGGINTGDAQQQENPLNTLLSSFGIQNPGQAALGGGLLGLGQLLNKDVTLPDFWSDRGVQDLSNWSKSASHPLDPNVQQLIQNNNSINRRNEVERLNNLYKNMRPGTDYLSDSNYQRDYADLTRKLSLNEADTLAVPQLESNRQNIGIMSNLAEGSIGQGRAQGLLDTQKQSNQNKLFGDLGSAFLQGSMQKPNVSQVNVGR